MTAAEIKQQIDSTFKTHLGSGYSTTAPLLPPVIGGGKLYEAFVLSKLIEQLALAESYGMVLVGGNKLYLKSAPGPINFSYPRIQLVRAGRCLAELWTDVEFTSLSCWLRSPTRITKGDYHELDIVVVDAGTSGRPRPDSIWLGVECKNTDYEKNLLKEILGVRRELSFVQRPMSTRFSSWPRMTVPANPPSCLLVYSTDSAVAQYSGPGATFGIDFLYEPM